LEYCLRIGVGVGVDVDVGVSDDICLVVGRP
jgi:hypothetical protein